MEDNEEYFLAETLIHEKFSDRVDKGGNRYINHLYSVSNKVNEDVEKIVALLHDAIEDIPEIDEMYLLEYGFSKDVVDIVSIVTKKADESYEDFIERIISSNNIHALRVKRADISNNMNLSRIIKPTDEDRERVLKKYKPNYKKINNKIKEMERK